MSAPVTLRDFVPGDAGAVHDWFNDEGTTAMLLEQRTFFATDEARTWVEKAAATDGEDRKWAISLPGFEPAAGFTALYGLGRQLAPEVGLLVAPAERHAGVGREALRLTLERAFEDHDAHRVYARILGSNEASKGLFAKLGFTQEGVMREHVHRNGDVIDVELWGLLAGEFADSGDLAPPAT